MAVAMLVWCALAAAPSTAQEERLEQPQWNRGYHGIALLCRSLNLEMKPDLASWRRVPPGDSVLIVAGVIENLPVDLVDYIGRGGAVLVASDRSDLGGFARLGIAFNRGPIPAASLADAFRSMNDCPVVTMLDPNSPVTGGLNRVITNRPGYLVIRSGLRNAIGGEWQIIGRLPFARGQRSPARISYGPIFLASIEASAGGGRLLMMSDHSILTNQMLTYGDNAKLVMQSLAWLRSGDRQAVLFVSDQMIATPLDPAQVAITLPPPKPSEVVAALRNLPPDALIDFGNSVVTAVEDEGVFDELITSSTSRMPIPFRNRMIATAATFVLVIVVLARFFSTRAPEAVAGIDLQRAPLSRRQARRRAEAERSRAAAALFARFRTELTGEAAVDPRAFVAGLRISGESLDSAPLWHEITKLNARLAPDGPAPAVRARGGKYWTSHRLNQLEAQINEWRRLHAAGIIRYDSPG